MNVAHGIGVTNRFELFGNEDVDPLEILRKREEEMQRKKTEKTQVKDKTKPAVAKAAKPIATTTTSPKKPLENANAKPVKEPSEVPNRTRGKQNERPPRSVGNYQDKETEKNMRNKDDQFFSDQRDGDFRRGRGGYRGRGGRDRGRGYFGNNEGRNRRMFDRHSGSDKTGVRPVDKRDGGGPNNWGDIRSDINQRTEETTWEEEFEAGGDRPREADNWGDIEATEGGKFGDDAQKSENEAAPDNTESKETDQTNEEQIQEAVREMTLDEYKREIEAKKTVHKFNIRKPGEGEDAKQWQKGYVLKKKVPLTDEEQDEDDEEEEEYGRKGQQKLLLDFQFNFTDSRRGMRGRGRGGRGGPRGGAGREGNRDSPREDRMRENRAGRGGRDSKAKGQQAAPRVDDFNDFPSLNNA
ncbi:HABP4_PAI-RBP1 domain-containing protein [Caerostris extrusa]|uniref:HABP4_PAI-RBP1 domain-containing protein n=1 Tax=Caerostris extrusa TaxID=172846 RepID=A0AAV4XJN5_CAEEX|nr:HABP4_PAI-RBP1 domain-containing protein [Caerostris extrusa]